MTTIATVFATNRDSHQTAHVFEDALNDQHSALKPIVDLYQDGESITATFEIDFANLTASYADGFYPAALHVNGEASEAVSLKREEYLECWQDFYEQTAAARFGVEFPDSGSEPGMILAHLSVKSSPDTLWETVLEDAWKMAAPIVNETDPGTFGAINFHAWVRDGIALIELLGELDGERSALVRNALLMNWGRLDAERVHVAGLEAALVAWVGGREDALDHSDAVRLGLVSA